MFGGLLILGALGALTWFGVGVWRLDDGWQRQLDAHALGHSEE